MDTNQKLREFMQQVQAIKPPYGDLVSNGIPAAGQSNVAAERLQELQRNAAAFAQAYQTPTTNSETITQRGDAVEKTLASAVTLGALQQPQADAILDNVLTLIAAREDM